MHAMPQPFHQCAGAFAIEPIRIIFLPPCVFTQPLSRRFLSLHCFPSLPTPRRKRRSCSCMLPGQQRSQAHPCYPGCRSRSSCSRPPASLAQHAAKAAGKTGIQSIWLQRGTRLPKQALAILYIVRHNASRYHLLRTQPVRAKILAMHICCAETQLLAAYSSNSATGQAI